jgi:hypothetical protein
MKQVGETEKEDIAEPETGFAGVVFNGSLCGSGKRLKGEDGVDKCR